MDTGNQTTVTVVALAGGLTAIGLWILGYVAPAFMATAPAGVEAAITTVVVAILGYVLPYDGVKKE
jgi:hypothetical protein